MPPKKKRRGTKDNQKSRQARKRRARRTEANVLTNSREDMDLESTDVSDRASSHTLSPSTVQRLEETTLLLQQEAEGHPRVETQSSASTDPAPALPILRGSIARMLEQLPAQPSLPVAQAPVAKSAGMLLSLQISSAIQEQLLASATSKASSRRVLIVDPEFMNTQTLGEFLQIDGASPSGNDWSPPPNATAACKDVSPETTMNRAPVASEPSEALRRQVPESPRSLLRPRGDPVASEPYEALRQLGGSALSKATRHTSVHVFPRLLLGMKLEALMNASNAPPP